MEKTKIVNWNREPYEFYHSKVKDINPRHEMYMVKNNMENKFAQKLGEFGGGSSGFVIPDREEHRPQYDNRIRPIDLASINIEKIH